MTAKIEKLEMVRGFASVYVLVGHILLSGALETAPWAFLFRFGQEAVMCFFLLSGFVIYLSSHQHRSTSFQLYFSRRWWRIYPVFLCALGIGWGELTFRGGHVDAKVLIGNLLMFQDFQTGKPGVWVSPFGGNLPLWSLAYEWWFYMMFFPIYRYVRASWHLIVVAAISLAGLSSYVFSPNQISLFLLYFVLWWTGVELAKTYCAGEMPSFRTQMPSLLLLSAFCLIVPIALYLGTIRPARLSLGLHPILQVRHFWGCFGIVTVALIWSKLRWKGFQYLFGPFQIVAPISYALYVFHYPVCVSGGFVANIHSEGLKFVVSLAAVIILSWAAEKPLQALIMRCRGRAAIQRHVRAPGEGREATPSDSVLVR